MREEVSIPFIDEVEREFAFLEQSHGFVVTDTMESAVRYESATVHVTIAHDRRTSEVQLNIGLRAFGAEEHGGYSIQDVVVASRLSMRGRPPACFANTESALHACMTRLAQLLEEYGAHAVTGNRAFFLNMSDASIIETKKSTIPSQSVRWARKEIETSWETGDHIRVARLYAWLDDQELSLAERSQRDFARAAFRSGDEY